MEAEAYVRAEEILRNKPMTAIALAKLLYPELLDERQLNRTTSILSWLKRRGTVVKVGRKWMTTS